MKLITGMEYLDDMFSQFAEAFLGIMAGDGDIPYRSNLTIAALNFTIESLKEVDRYIGIVHKNLKNISNIEYQNVVVWCGAYVGEVIRKNASIEYHWVHYDDYMKDRDQDFKNLIPLTLPTHALLSAVNLKHMTMPMNKVARWLHEGSSNNLEYYASTDIAKKNIN